jgi:hypothetical protein
VSDLAEVRAPQGERPRCRICHVRIASFSPWVMLTLEGLVLRLYQPWRDYGLLAILDTGSSFSFV